MKPRQPLTRATGANSSGTLFRKIRGATVPLLRFCRPLTTEEVVFICNVPSKPLIASW